MQSLHGAAQVLNPLGIRKSQSPNGEQEKFNCLIKSVANQQEKRRDSNDLNKDQMCISLGTWTMEEDLSCWVVVKHGIFK
jgi:hypothetical protein